jgi:hypothetical protein
MDDFLFFMGIIMMLFVLPFAMFGIYCLSQKIIEFLRVRKGWIRGRWIMPNKREFPLHVKPLGKEVKVKLLGKEKTYKFNPSKMTFDGYTPIMTWNVDDMEPVDIMNKTQQGTMSAHDISMFIIRAFNLGKIEGMKKQNILIILVIGCMLISAGSLIASIMNINLLQLLGPQVQTLLDNTGKILTNMVPVLPK